jgi:hypothetical protein
MFASGDDNRPRKTWATPGLIFLNFVIRFANVRTSRQAGRPDASACPRGLMPPRTSPGEGGGCPAGVRRRQQKARRKMQHPIYF